MTIYQTRPKGRKQPYPSQFTTTILYKFGCTSNYSLFSSLFIRHKISIFHPFIILLCALGRTVRLLFWHGILKCWYLTVFLMQPCQKRELTLQQNRKMLTDVDGELQSSLHFQNFDHKNGTIIPSSAMWSLVQNWGTRKERRRGWTKRNSISDLRSKW